MRFSPYSALEIPRERGLIASDKKSLNAFWEEVDEVASGLSSAIGCYIFSIRAGKGVLPWYVGLAEKQTFRKECFTSHKLVHYNHALAQRKGTPVLTLIAKCTPGGKFVIPTGSAHRDIEFLETMLIASSLGRNENLYNVRDTKLLREMVVPGFLNTPQGKAASAVSEFKKLIGS